MNKLAQHLEEQEQEERQDHSNNYDPSDDGLPAFYELSVAQLPPNQVFQKLSRVPGSLQRWAQAAVTRVLHDVKIRSAPPKELDVLDKDDGRLSKVRDDDVILEYLQTGSSSNVEKTYKENDQRHQVADG